MVISWLVVLQLTAELSKSTEKEKKGDVRCYYYN